LSIVVIVYNLTIKMADNNEEQPRRATRALTQRYDMNALRAIQNIEENYQKAIAELYGCDEDDVPIEIDTLALFNAKPEARRDILVRSIT
jgi:hypothetical protein